jgi:hypothetical protein
VQKTDGAKKTTFFFGVCPLATPQQKQTKQTKQKQTKQKQTNICFA